ncbi:MAG: 2Fe-2S iron-sulfur cluster-binding protein, partial [Acidobacteriota bacterium]
SQTQWRREFPPWYHGRMESALIRCLINGRPAEIDVSEIPSGLTVLDYVRGHLRTTGTKEGCKEGDCGACVVLLGELDGDRVRYRPMTSCMMPVAEVAGRHLVTIEGLDVDGAAADGPATVGPKGEGLNTAQREIVAAGASQCGFCTPGIVVSVMGHLLDEDLSTVGAGLDDDVDRALSGHLCRCTGNRSLR